jgi:threonine aldolase
VAEERDRDAIVAQCTRFVPAHVDPGRGDWYGEGKPIKAFEERVAGLLGKPAAALFPTGTMAQQVALRIWADRGGVRTVAFHPQSHVEVHEEKGYEHLHGLHARLVGVRDRLIELADLEAIAERIAVLLLELPQRDLGGQLPSWEDLVAQTEWARAHDVALHLDGARLWQCGPFYGRDLSEVAALFDTVYVSLYKDLGGLGGCLLAGPEDVIAEARVWRVRHGGRLATFEPLASSGARGLDEVLPRMAEFVEKARSIGAALASIDGIDVLPDPPQVAMLHVYARANLDRLRDAVLDIAEERKILIGGRFAPTPLPGVQRMELSVGASTCEIPTEDVAELYAELLARATR